MSIQHLRRLPLEGAPNTRDLGGHPCPGGRTRWGVFLRSGSPQSLTDSDILALAAYGVDCSLDLRSDEECSRGPSLLKDAAGFSYHRVSLNDGMHAVNFEGDLPGSMSGLYISLLDNARDELARIMNILADAKGGALFHCAVGKDRTGVVAMLLLKLAGVTDPDIVADYSVTEVYMREIFQGYMGKDQNGYEMPDYVLRSIPESMWRVLKHLEEAYGNARDYLLGCGVTATQIDVLKQKFFEKA